MQFTYVSRKKMLLEFKISPHASNTDIYKQFGTFTKHVEFINTNNV